MPIPVAVPSSRTPYDERAVAPHTLLPIVRPRSSCAHEALADRIFGEGLQHVAPVGRIGSDLVIALAADLPSGARLLEQPDLQTLGLTAAAAFEQAVANLLQRSPPRFAPLGRGVFSADWNDGFDATRLLLVHLFDALPLRGDAVAMVPTSGRLLLAGADDKDGLLAMAETAASALSTTDRPLSAQPLRLRAGVWRSFAPDPDEFAPLQDLLRGQWIRDYAEQKQLLDQLHAQEGEQVAVADELAMLDRRSGRPFCLTFWIEGAPSLLPRADAIGFKTAAEVILVPWPAALPIVGGRMTKTDHYPERYRVATFPNAGELARLRSVATLAKAAKSA
jgi:hypothetical protein